MYQKIIVYFLFFPNPDWRKEFVHQRVGERPGEERVSISGVICAWQHAGLTHTALPTDTNCRGGAPFEGRDKKLPPLPFDSTASDVADGPALWLPVWDIMDRVYDYFLCVPQGRPGCSLPQRPSHHSAPGIHYRGCAEVSTVHLYVLCCW